MAGAVLLLFLTVCPSARLTAQGWRVVAWGAYEGVTDADDWSALGGQLSRVSRRGHGAWLAAEQLGRFGARDVTVRVGGVWHPGPRWWITAEFSTGTDPEFAPKNAWEADATTLLGPRAGVGVGYRRQNYFAGPVDVAIPHLRVEVGRTSWDARVFLSRNPSERTDVAYLVRVTVPVGPRAAAWLGAGAGRESFVVGTPPAQTVRSLETVTGVVGARYNAGKGMILRMDATVVRSRPVLSRRGVAVAIERSF